MTPDDWQDCAINRKMFETRKFTPGELTMHRMLIGAACFTLSACVNGGTISAETKSEDRLKISSALADRFQAELQGQLQAAMQQLGPVGAIDLCNSAAPAIAQSLSAESGAQVRRIALRQRNPDARAVGEWRKRLEALAAAPLDAEGKPAVLTWTSGSGKNLQTHYLRAIPMKEQPCAACHGTNVSPEVQARIRALYPDDQATGFKPGELRGAIAISWPAR